MPRLQDGAHFVEKIGELLTTDHIGDFEPKAAVGFGLPLAQFRNRLIDDRRDRIEVAAEFLFAPCFQIRFAPHARGRTRAGYDKYWVIYNPL